MYLFHRFVSGFSSGRQTDRQTDRQTISLTDRQTDTQTDRQIHGERETAGYEPSHAARRRCIARHSMYLFQAFVSAFGLRVSGFG